jgi:hypothetical protein
LHSQKVVFQQDRQFPDICCICEHKIRRRLELTFKQTIFDLIGATRRLVRASRDCIYIFGWKPL